MVERLPVFLPRVAVLVLLALALSAGLTFAAGQQITASAPSAVPTAPRKAETIVVPDLRHQAFVFVKQQLADAGFAWRVTGAVHGYAPNMVVGQSPAPGTKLVDTGSPPITLTLARNGSYPQQGEAADASPYAATPLRLADVAVAAAPPLKQAAPKHAAAKDTAPKHAASKPSTTAATAAATAAAAAPARRPPDFVVPGARKEPLDEIALPARAAQLGTWLAAHRKPTNASVEYWLYQNAWIVAGARMGWWHGAEALRTLIAVDSRAESVWGIGARSENVARRALAEVEARKQ